MKAVYKNIVYDKFINLLVVKIFLNRLLSKLLNIKLFLLKTNNEKFSSYLSINIFSNKVISL